MRFKNFSLKLLFILFDGLSIAASILLAYLLRGYFLSPNDIPLAHYLYFVPNYTPLLLFAYEGLYTQRYDFWQETRLIIKALVLSFLIVLSYLAITKNIEHYSRFVIVTSFVIMSFVIPLQKRWLKWILYHFGIWKKEARLYGDDPFLKDAIFDSYYLGYIEGEGDTVFINSTQLPPTQIEKILKEEIRKHHRLYFIPILRDFNLADSKILEFFNTRINLVSLTNRLENRRNILAKRVFDQLVAGTLFIVLSPLMAIIAVSIALSEPGRPVFYRQKRLGKGAKEFFLLKFRTMYTDSDTILEDYLCDHPEMEERWRRYKKLPDDPRVTIIGRFLRRFSLDELPQLLNVLKGQMSLVGPRPYIPDELENIDERDIILSVRPGITGLWQVLGRSRLSFQERIRIDIWYVYNWSLWKDIVILLKTVVAVIKQEGAH